MVSASAFRTSTASTGYLPAAVSPDGRWLAYTLERPNYHRDLMLREFASGREVTVSDGLADVAAPAFGADGKTLWLCYSANFSPGHNGENMKRIPAGVRGTMCLHEIQLLPTGG